MVAASPSFDNKINQIATALHFSDSCLGILSVDGPAKSAQKLDSSNGNKEVCWKSKTLAWSMHFVPCTERLHT